MQNKDCQKSLDLCPFCGGKAEVIDATDEWNETYFVLCPNCGVSTINGINEEEAINAWNTRVKK